MYTNHNDELLPVFASCVSLNAVTKVWKDRNLQKLWNNEECSYQNVHSPGLDFDPGAPLETPNKKTKSKNISLF